jgi:acetyl-CoA carboxylase carboxyl transferase subunit alpha
MLEHAVYAVISPEGCASILWRDAARASDAAQAMNITAPDLLRLGVIHGIVYEPKGGAHRDPADMIKRLSLAVRTELDGLMSLSRAELRSERRDFFMQLGRT